MPASSPDCDIRSRASTWDKALAQNGLVSSHDCAMFPTHGHHWHHESPSHNSEGEHSVGAPDHHTRRWSSTNIVNGAPSTHGKYVRSRPSRPLSISHRKIAILCVDVWLNDRTRHPEITRSFFTTHHARVPVAHPSRSPVATTPERNRRRLRGVYRRNPGHPLIARVMSGLKRPPPTDPALFKINSK